MDAKDLRTQPTLSGRNNDGGKYAQSGGVALQCDRNKTYQDIGPNSLAKVEVQNARPCAVIGPDRIVPQPTTEEYMKKGPVEPWPCTDNTYRRPPEYPRKLTNYINPTRNISPRQTYQENMQRIMVPATYNSVKMNDDTNNYAQIPDRNIPLSKNIKLNVPSEAKYCDVPYAVNPNSNEQKNVRNSDMCMSSVNPSVSRTAPHGWPPGSVNLRPARSYAAPELYQYQEYPSCAGPRPIVPRPHRSHPEDPAYVYAEPYYSDGNIRFKPYPTVKDRYPPARYDYIGNYSNPFHPPPSYPTHKYDLQKSMPPHPFPPYASVKYLDNRIPEPILDGYQRNQQGNYNMPYPNQVIHPNYGTVIGNCSQNKMHTFPPDSSIKTIAPNKLSYDNNNKTYVEYDNSRPKIYPQPDSYFVSEMGRIHPMKSQVLMPNYPNLNMHTGPPNPYYKKDSAQIKNYEYMAHFRNLDPAMNIHNPMMRHLPMFSPTTLAISPTDSSASNDTNQTLGASQEDCGYVSQSSTASVRSMESGMTRVPNDYYRKYYDSRYGHIVRTSPMTAKTELLPNNNTSKDKKNINVRQFLQMWNEGDEETENTNSKELATKMGSSKDNMKKTHEVANNNNEQLYVLGLVNVPSEELSKYEHIQTVSKLPENIKGYNNIELLNQFEEVIESTNLGNYKSQASKDNFQMQVKGIQPKQLMGILPRPISPLDVEAKISQSVIHKEVGCNFEIKPCSPKMLNVDVAAPVKNILAERVIEKVANPVSKSPMLNSIEENIDCNLMKRSDHRINMNDNVRNSSCKMINTQYPNINPIDTIKSTYSLQDLESNSGLCLASLPRLDNDIELNFPEVNQQFINANRREAAVTSPLKDLPTLEMLDQSVNEVKHKDSSIPVLELEYKMSQSFSNVDPEKEFPKLSKYRKNKTNITEDEKKSLVTKKEKVQYNQNAIRTDSVIIKNPENIKKYDEISDLSTNGFNEPQQTPMNLTSQINGDFDVQSQLENVVESKCNTKDEDNQSIDVAIDFSLNRNHLTSDIKSTDTEINIEKDNPIHEVEENNKTFDEDLCQDLTFNTKSDANKPIDVDGHKSDDSNSNTDVNYGTPVRDTEDMITTHLNQEANYCTRDSNMSQSESDSDLKNGDEEKIYKETSDDYANLQRILTSENHVVESLPILSDDFKMKDDPALENQFSEETQNLMKMDVETYEFQNNGNMEIEKELALICDNHNSKSEETTIKQVHGDIKTNLNDAQHMHTDLNDGKNSSALVFSPQNIDCAQINLMREESNNNIEETIPLIVENISGVNPQNSQFKEDIVNNHVNAVPSHDVINVSDDNPSSNPTKDLEPKGIESYNSEENSGKVMKNEVCGNTSLGFDKIRKGKRQFWSKKYFSPWIKNLTFSLGIVNTQRNVDIIGDIVTEKSYVENTSFANLNVDEIVEPVKDLESVSNKDSIDIVATSNSHSGSITNYCDSVDEIESKTETHIIKNYEEVNTTDENNILNDEKDKTETKINEMQSNTLSPIREPSVEDDKKDSEMSETNNSECDDQNIMILKNEINVKAYLTNEDKSMISEDSPVPETNYVDGDIENQIQKIRTPKLSVSAETNDSIQEDKIGGTLTLSVSAETNNSIQEDKIGGTLELSVSAATNSIQEDKIGGTLELPVSDETINSIQEDKIGGTLELSVFDETNNSIQEDKIGGTLTLSVSAETNNSIQEDKIGGTLKLPVSDETNNSIQEDKIGGTLELTVSDEINNSILEDKIGGTLELPVSDETNNSIHEDKIGGTLELPVSAEINNSIHEDKIGGALELPVSDETNNSILEDKIGGTLELSVSAATNSIQEDKIGGTLELSVCDETNNSIHEDKIGGTLELPVSDETNNSIQGEEIGEHTKYDNTIEKAIAAEDEEKCNKARCDGFETLLKRRRPLKRSLSDSALHVYNVRKDQESANEDIQFLLPIKRKKISKLESVDLCSIIQNNRRNSISAIYNEDDVSFCILIDNSCIITEEEEGDEQKICYTEFSEGCLELQTDTINAEDENLETVGPVISSPRVNVQCEDSFTLQCEEDKALGNSWVEDVGCVETVICDDIAEDIVISGPPYPKDDYFSENDESGVFSSSEHTDQVKYLYGDKMCSHDAQYLETLYNTPQMDVYKALNSRDTQALSECVKYYDKDSLEKVLSESNGKEPYSSEFMNSIMPISVSNCNTPDDKENIMDIFSSPQSNLNCEDIVEDIELNHEQENLLPESMFSQSQEDIVHSCESSIDDVFAGHASKEDNTNFMISSSPEVSSTTSEEKNSGILLKITNYKGSRISQINGISSVNNRPRCKFTEEKDYLHSHSNFSKHRPLLTKAAQKYIPPIKESIRDLKVKLTLPQHSLMKLKQLKKSKDVPKPIKQTNNNMPRIPKKPKPKFEDVLMSIDEIQFQKHKEKSKKAKKSIPKVVIKKSQNGSHYASTSNKDEFNPDLTGRKWQPWVFLEKNIFIDKMAIRNKTKAIYSHRKKCYVLAEEFKKYKAVNSAKFVISQPKTDNSSTGLKYTIRLKHSY